MNNIVDEKEAKLCQGRCAFAFQPTETREKANKETGEVTSSVISGFLFCQTCTALRDIQLEDTLEPDAL